MNHAHFADQRKWTSKGQQIWMAAFTVGRSGVLAATVEQGRTILCVMQLCAGITVEESNRRVRVSKTGEVMNDICKKHDAIVEDMENLMIEAVEGAYEQGWRAAAEWAKRDDLVSDIGSPAYEKDRKFRLAGV